MNTRMYAKTAAAGLILAATFGLTACGDSNDTTTTTTTGSNSSSSSSTSTTAMPTNGTEAVIKQETGNKIMYYVTPPKGGMTKGDVTITVGDWKYHTKEAAGSVVPQVHHGDYTATIVYTNLDGGTLTKTTPYHLGKASSIEVYPKKTSGPIGKPWNATVQITGNPIVSGTVQLFDSKGVKVSEGTVGPDNIASLPMPAKDKAYNEHMTFKYLGDDDNPAGQKIVAITYDSHYDE